MVKWDMGKVKAAVIDAESRTSGEIVPVVVTISGEYSETRYLAALTFTALGSLAAYLAGLRYPWLLELEHLLLLQLMLAVVGYLTGSLAPLVRLMAGRARMADNVRNAALAAFLRHGLAETRDRTGVLIYISLLEHRVEILGDKGIHERVGEGFWTEEAAKLVAGIRAGRPEEALSEVVGDVGRKLAEYFPKRGDDANELEDHLRTR